MEQRVNIEKLQPETWKALYHLSAVISKSSLTPVQAHLVKVRVSQLNSCAYCINMHTKEALAVGETQQRLFLLSAWKESSVFTGDEKALLQLAEEVTLIHVHGVSDSTYSEATKYFSAAVISEIIMASILMNTWNRIAVSTRLGIL